MNSHPETDCCVSPVPAALQTALLHAAGARDIARTYLNEGLIAEKVRGGDLDPAEVADQCLCVAVSFEDHANALAPNLLRTCVSALRAHGILLAVATPRTVSEWIEYVHDRLEFAIEIDDPQTEAAEDELRLAGLALFHLNNAVTAGLADAVLTP